MRTYAWGDPCSFHCQDKHIFFTTKTAYSFRPCLAPVSSFHSNPAYMTRIERNISWKNRCFMEMLLREIVWWMAINYFNLVWTTFVDHSWSFFYKCLGMMLTSERNMLYESTFWKSIFKQQLGCRFDIMDSISSFFCILTYAIIYVLIHHIIFWLYLYFLNIHYFFKYSCTNIFHRCSLYTFYYM